MWVEFIAGSRPCSEGFSPGTPVSLPPQKPTFPNSNSIWNPRATGLSVVKVSPSLNKVDLFTYKVDLYTQIQTSHSQLSWQTLTKNWTNQNSRKMHVIQNFVKLNMVNSVRLVALTGNCAIELKFNWRWILSIRNMSCKFKRCVVFFKCLISILLLRKFGNFQLHLLFDKRKYKWSLPADSIG